MRLQLGDHVCVRRTLREPAVAVRRRTTGDGCGLSSPSIHTGGRGDGTGRGSNPKAVDELLLQRLDEDGGSFSSTIFPLAGVGSTPSVR